MKEVLFVSRNERKLDELKFILGSGYNVFSLDDLGYTTEIEETGNTYYENAMIKVRAGLELFKGNIIAEDSGLEIDYLNGLPGINSARFLGVNTSASYKNNVILKELKDAPYESRTARYVSCAILALPGYPNDMYQIAYGVVEGHIAFKPEGLDGYAYDPIFKVDKFDTMMSLLTTEQMNDINHRHQSFSKLKQFIV